MIFLEIIVVVIGHSEILVGCVIRNDLRVQSLKMRQTLEKWTWCNTYSCSGSNRSQSEFHDLLSSDWVDTLLVPDPISEFEDCVPGFGIWDFRLLAWWRWWSDNLPDWGAEILNPHGFPSPVNISRFLSFNYVPSEIQSQIQAQIQIRMEIWISPLVKISWFQSAKYVQQALTTATFPG